MIPGSSTPSTSTRRGRRSRTALTLATASAGALVATLFTGGSASADSTGAQVWVHDSNGTLYKPQSRKCLGDPGHSLLDAQVQIRACHGTEGQDWQLLAF